MPILTLGLNHNSAPVSIREKLSFPTERLHEALKGLIELPSVQEAAILSTCNRTELYCGLKHGDQSTLIDWIAREQQLRRDDFCSFLYTHAGPATIRHMFRVACGLDSMVLGEPQILGQMKTAYQIANEAGTLGRTLGRLFQHTFTAAKKVRTDTAIGSSPVSVAFAAVSLARQFKGHIGDKTCGDGARSPPFDSPSAYSTDFRIRRPFLSVPAKPSNSRLGICTSRASAKSSSPIAPTTEPIL